MGIDSESEVAADLVVGPTTSGMVRIYVAAEGIELPMDFDPDEALEIAEELRVAAEAARAAGGRGGSRGARHAAGNGRRGRGSDQGGRSR